MVELYMKLYRSDKTVIEKEKINLEGLALYDEKKIKQASCYLNQYIDESFVNFFDYISYVLENRKEANFASYNPNAGCISENKKLQKKLNELGMKTYFVSCEAANFSTRGGGKTYKRSSCFSGLSIHS